jgi:hypothetical protein
MVSLTHSVVLVAAVLRRISIRSRVGLVVAIASVSHEHINNIDERA